WSRSRLGHSRKEIQIGIEAVRYRFALLASIDTRARDCDLVGAGRKAQRVPALTVRNGRSVARGDSRPRNRGAIRGASHHATQSSGSCLKMRVAIGERELIVIARVEAIKKR